MASEIALVEQSPSDQSLAIERVEESTVDELPRCSVSTRHMVCDQLDGRRAFVVLGAVFLIILLTGALPPSTGVYYATMIDYFSASREQVSWLFVNINATMALAGLVTPAAIGIVGRRRLLVGAATMAVVGTIASAFASELSEVVVWYGIVSGFSLGLCYFSAFGAFAPWFSRHRQLACALVHTGQSVGNVLWPIVLHEWQREYTWRGAMLLSGACLLNIAAVARLVQRSPAEESTKLNCFKLAARQPRFDIDSRASPSILRQYRHLATDIRSHLFMLVVFFHTAYWIFAMVITRYALDERSLSDSQAGAFLPLASLADLFTRLVLTVCNGNEQIARRLPRYAIYYALTAASVVGHVAIVYARSFGAMLALAAVFGSAYGAGNALLTGIELTCFGADAVGLMRGYEYFGSALQCLIMLPLAARLSDNAESFDVAFFIAAAQLSAGVLVLAACQWRSRVINRGL